MPKAFLLTNKRYDLYNLNIPISWRQQPVLPLVKAEDDNNNGSDSVFRQRKRLPDLEIRPVPTPPSDENYEEEEIEEPVNLSLKKFDIFSSLRQLAEVSISIVPDSTSSSPFCSYNDDNLQIKSSTSARGAYEICEADDSHGSVEIEIDEGYHPESACSSSNESTESGSGSGSTSRNAAHHTLHSCAECGKGYSTLSNLLRHRQTHRSTTDSNAVKTCPYCDKVYVSMPAFSMHLRTHNQGCKCPYCGKLFSRPWLLQGHIRTHTGEKPFECPSCNKKFADKSNLRAHTQTHSTDKPYTCKRCSKKFGLKSYLSKHIESSCMKSASPAIGTIAITSTSSKARKRLQGNAKVEAGRRGKLETSNDVADVAMVVSSSSYSSSPSSSIGSSIG